jgi:hypothetical protein
MELRTQTPGEVNGDRHTRTGLRRPMRRACKPLLLCNRVAPAAEENTRLLHPGRKDVTTERCTSTALTTYGAASSSKCQISKLGTTLGISVPVYHHHHLRREPTIRDTPPTYMHDR